LRQFHIGDSGLPGALPLPLPGSIVWRGWHMRPEEPVPEWCKVPYHIDNEGRPAGSIDAARAGGTDPVFTDA